MAIRIGDLLKLPNAIQSELESRSQIKAREMANNLVNRIAGKHLQTNSSQSNGAKKNELGIDARSEAMGIGKGGNWGGGGW